MAATYPFLWFPSIKESYKRLIPTRYTLYRKSFITSKKIKISFWVGNLESFRFLYRRYTYEVVPIYWLELTLDPCPWEMNQYFLLELHHGLFPFQPNKKKKERFEWNRTNDVEPRAPSFLYKMVDVRIHNGSCPSSRTLLSTTSFQTKFYHNIFLISSRYAIDSIIESWIIIGSVGT